MQIPKTIDDMITYSYENFRDRVFCFEKVDGVYEGKTYAQFYADVWALADSLIKDGYKDKKFMIYGHNSYNWMVVYLAVSAYVGTIVPIDANWKENDLQNVVASVDISLIFHSKNLTENLKKIDTAQMALEDMEQLLGSAVPKATPNPDIDRICKIAFTSGTTSKPKRVLLTERNLMANAEEYLKIFSAIDETDVLFLCLPLSHIFASVIVFLYPIYKGTTIFVSSSFGHLPQELREAQPTIFVGVPKLFQKIVDSIDDKTMRKIEKGIKISNLLRKFGVDARKTLFKELHSFFGGRIRFMYSGAASADYKLLKFYEDLGITIMQGYGMTEASPVISCDEINNYRLGSVGKILSNLKYKIINQDENGVGELCVSGDNVAMQARASDGYLYTGDLARIDKDGYLYIVGRKKRVIITSNGKNIYPDELEALLLENSAIKSALVFEQNDRVCAKIKAKPPLQEVEYFVAKVNEILPNYKQIRKTIMVQNVDVTDDTVDTVS